MKNAIIFLFFYLTSFVVVAQNEKEIRNHSFFVNADFYHTGMIKKEASIFIPPDSVYNTSGFSFGTDLSMTENDYLSLNWRLGYRYVSDYQIIDLDSYYSFSTGILRSNYNGFFTGPKISYGQKHKVELAFLLGFGNKKWNTGGKVKDSEATVSFGYKYMAKKQLFVNVGSFINLGRDLFDKPYYAGYFGVGYNLKTQQNEIKRVQNHKKYFAVGLTGYILNLQLNLIGLGAQVDYFFFNGEVLDFGMSTSFKIGIDFNEDIKSDLSVFPTALFGKGEDKFELFLGPNLTFGEYSEKSIYNFVNFGMGYRLNSESLHLRIGVATTSWVYGSLGVNF